MNNTKFYFPVHLNGANRGCEGIAKGTALILGTEKEKLIGLCTDIKLDQSLGIDSYISLYPSRKPTLIDNFLFHVYPRIWPKDKVYLRNQQYWYDSFLNLIEPCDIMLSTGGDMLCYDNNFVIYTNNKLSEKGVKTVLWGCSMGPENLTPEKEDTLRKFNFIYARESLTEEFLRSLGLQNVYCYPDPAFVLTPEITELPETFKNHEVIGINISNFVLGGFSLNTKFGRQVKMFIDFLLKETDYHLLLIPHVTRKEQDDMIVAKNIKKEYDSNRVSILDISHKNYCQIRYVIANCKYFVGGRTHAVISAYSTCVPTIALGYSIKSRGIAKDLGLSEQLVVNSKNPKSESELLDSFKLLCRTEDEVRKKLKTIMPSYTQRPYEMRNVMNNFFNLDM